MSRPAVPRSLTLTEELERLEQQITLTLQEIDSNFSKAHRVVTSNILPIVERYAQNSHDVWEHSKYWKQFFEAAANVSLSGYEEAALDDELPSTSEHTTTDLTTPEQPGAGVVQHASDDDDDDFTVDSPTQISGMQSTPKLRTSAQRDKGPQTYAHSPSPRRYTGRNPLAQSDEPSTPNAGHSHLSSPFQQISATKPADHNNQSKLDPVLHRSVLDKNYRVQSTPHRSQPHVVHRTEVEAAKRAPWDDSPGSSPEMVPPQLRDDFFSPARRASTQQAPRTPGVSVQTLVKGKTGAISSAATVVRGSGGVVPEDDADFHEEDSDLDFGMSPPKTLQFHIPQSRLMQTPAQEASRKIVDDLLATAGLGDNTIDELEASPSGIRMSHDDDSTF